MLVKSYHRNCLVAVLFLCSLIKECISCFTEDESEVTKVKSGSSFYEECRCDEPGPTGVHLKWFDINDQEVIALGPGTKSNVYTEWLDENVYGLYISNVTKSISGAYKCVTNFNGQQYTKIFYIEAYDLPYFVNTAEIQYLVNGKDQLVICEARGETDPFISWHKDKDGFIEISDDDKYEIVSSKGLIIRNVTNEDRGIYKCTASDLETGEGIDKDIKVEVTYMPTVDILVATPEATVVVGETLTIECVAKGVPPPEYIWRKVSEMEPEDVNVTWHQITNTIVFDSVVAEDRGTYECTAFNGAGNATKEIKIDVLVPPEITQFNNISIIEGETPQIICKAVGRPRPKVSMTFEGDASDDNKGIYWHIWNTSDFETKFQLSFSQVKRSHQGIYICNASNEVDVATKEMYMSVLHKPYLNSPTESLWGWNGKVVNLTCENESNPPSRIYWRYQGNDISTAEQVLINNMLEEKVNNTSEYFIPLLIDKPSLYGVYECVVRNDYGEDTKTITLREGFIPPPIKNVTILEITSTSATFAIIGPNEVNGPPVIGFTAEYDESNNYDVTDIHINRTWSIDRPYKVDKLKPNTTYYIKFAAVNDVGAGPWSESLEFITLETSAPDPPEWDVESESLIVASNKQVLSWKIPEYTEDPIDYYVIRFCPTVNSVVQDYLCQEEIIKSTEFELSDFQYNTTYSLEIIAHNSQGNSSASRLYVIMPAEDLSPMLSAGAVIGLSVVVIFICLLLLDLLFLLWRRQGIIAKCCYKKKNKRKEDSLRSRDKKGLLKTGESTSGESIKRPSNGHKEYEYDKTTGVIIGKHSAV
ncbi:unnamed protein product [Parnassius apollo]|uniref:(apollo) hypothetical protein n=1 Tax=Parnassius apollo TaxID=110799 RepID=A0A8S3W7V0_PARAO|nr:unnamed protein product [Parnassius apollo]CAG4945968.1 unnamed protein product [Parnassius apollo]